MKCAICNSKIEKTFLDKIIGTYVKNMAVCSDCQKKYNMDEIKKKI